MSLTLTVDGPRWRAHLESVADAHPGIVPVARATATASRSAGSRARPSGCATAGTT